MEELAHPVSEIDENASFAAHFFFSSLSAPKEQLSNETNVPDHGQDGDQYVLRELKKSFQLYIVDFITFANGKITKYMTVGKRISGSFKRAQPGVASFIRLGVV